MFNKNKKHAFTLIEVVIVIFIIGLLATALIPKILSAQGRTRDSKRKADIYTISNALETYYLDKSKYPHSFSGIYISSTNNPSERIPGLVGEYLSSIPTDPLNNFTGANADSIPWGSKSFSYLYHEPEYLFLNGAPRAYTVNNGGKKIYQLMANLETPEDNYTCNKLGALMEVRYYANNNRISWPVCRWPNTYQSYFSVMPAQTTQ